MDSPTRTAFTHFARGRYHLLKLTPQSCANATLELENAVAADPEFAPAHAYLALAPLQGADLLQTTYRAVSDRVRHQIAAAMSLDPDLPEGVAALATHHFRCLWEWEAAEDSFRRALRLNPSALHAYLEYGALLDCLGRFEEALEQNRTALRVDPASPLVHVCLSLTHWFRREYEEAQAWCREALRLDPYYFGLVRGICG